MPAAVSVLFREAVAGCVVSDAAGVLPRKRFESRNPREGDELSSESPSRRAEIRLAPITDTLVFLFTADAGRFRQFRRRAGRSLGASRTGHRQRLWPVTTSFPMRHRHGTHQRQSRNGSESSHLQGRVLTGVPRRSWRGRRNPSHLHSSTPSFIYWRVQRQQHCVPHSPHNPVPFS